MPQSNNLIIKGLRNLFHKSSTTTKVSPQQAKTIGNSLFVDWKKVSVKTLTQGMSVELEHTETLRSLGIPEKDILKTAAKIALDHLSEDSQYYDKLKKMEGK